MNNDGEEGPSSSQEQGSLSEGRSGREPESTPEIEATIGRAFEVFGKSEAIRSDVWMLLREGAKPEWITKAVDQAARKADRVPVGWPYVLKTARIAIENGGLIGPAKSRKQLYKDRRTPMPEIFVGSGAKRTASNPKLDGTVAPRLFVGCDPDAKSVTEAAELDPNLAVGVYLHIPTHGNGQIQQLDETSGLARVVFSDATSHLIDLKRAPFKIIDGSGRGANLRQGGTDR